MIIRVNSIKTENKVSLTLVVSIPLYYKFVLFLIESCYVKNWLVAEFL